MDASNEARSNAERDAPMQVKPQAGVNGPSRPIECRGKGASKWSPPKADDEKSKSPEKITKAEASTGASLWTSKDGPSEVKADTDEAKSIRARP